MIDGNTLIIGAQRYAVFPLAVSWKLAAAAKTSLSPSKLGDQMHNNNTMLDGNGCIVRSIRVCHWTGAPLWLLKQALQRAAHCSKAKQPIERWKAGLKEVY